MKKGLRVAVVTDVVKVLVRGCGNSGGGSSDGRGVR